MKRLNATQRRRLRAARKPKPSTIVCQPYDIEQTAWVQSPYALVETSLILERSWNIAATVELAYTELKALGIKHNAAYATHLIAARVEVAILSVKAKADEMMREAWGSLLPRRRAIV